MPQRLPDDVAAAPDSARIRVGIRLPGEVVPAYLATALGRVLAVARERIEIVAVVVQPRRLDSPSSADRLYEALDGLIYGRGIDPLTPTRAPAGLRSVIRRGHAPEADPTHPFDGADVILDLVGEPYSGPVPPFGRWHLVFTAGLHGAPERALRSAGADGLGMAALVADLDDRSVAIEQIVGALPSAGFGRSRAALYWGSASFMARALERLASSRSVEGARSGAALDGSTMIADSAGGQHRSRSPGGRRWAELATVTARRSFERAVYREGWTVLYRRRDAWDAFAPPRDLRGFRRVPAPVDRFFADPFVVAEDGRHCLYVEESAAGQHAGVISQLELDGDRWSAPETILSTGRHLSYPHVTRVDGRLVMVVDESASGAVTVYEREDVGWRPGPVLVDGIRASDPTLFEHGGRLWLLATVTDVGMAPWDELHLFSAPSLNAEWRAHPRNPVVADARRSRPAGRVLRIGDRLVRPGQDCSRSYGRRIVLSSITTLTETEYEERVIGTIEPTGQPGVTRTHCYTTDGDVEVLDGFERVARWSRRRPSSSGPA